MALTQINERRIKKILHTLHYKEPISKSRIAYITGLHYFVVQDVLAYLKANGEVLEASGKWLLKSKDVKG